MAARPFSISAVGVKGPLLFAAGDTPRKMGICTSTQAHTLLVRLRQTLHTTSSLTCEHMIIYFHDVTS